MTVDLCTYIISTATSLIVGIITSYAVWRHLNIRLAPKLKIGEKLYRYLSPENDGAYVYKAKVTNLSESRPAFDLKLSARAYVYGLVSANDPKPKRYLITTGVRYSPYITCINKAQEGGVEKNELEFIIRPPFSKSKEGRGKLRRLYNERHSDHPKTGVFSLEDVFHIVEAQQDKTVIEFCVTATCEYSGSRKHFNRFYHKDDFEYIDEVYNANNDLDDQNFIDEETETDEQQPVI